MFNRFAAQAHIDELCRLYNIQARPGEVPVPTMARGDFALDWLGRLKEGSLKIFYPVIYTPADYSAALHEIGHWADFDARLYLDKMIRDSHGLLGMACRVQGPAQQWLVPMETAVHKWVLRNARHELDLAFMHDCLLSYEFADHGHPPYREVLDQLYKRAFAQRS